jgi:hypothetical protein
VSLVSIPKPLAAAAAAACRASGPVARRARACLRRYLPAGVVALTLTGLMPAAPATAAAAASWSLVSSPDALISQDRLVAVSCPDGGFCMAIGQAVTPAGGWVPLAMSWNGRTWTARRFPVPARAKYTEPAAVSCTSARYCIAVGSYGSDQFAARWYHHTWTIVLSKRAGILDAVSCSAYDACTAVGTSGNPIDSVTNEIAERWNGRTWTSQRVPVFPGPSSITFSGVACTSATVCMAVGSDWDLGDFTNPIAARWTRRKWKPVTIRYQDPYTEDSANALSCSSARACTAIGYSTDPGGDFYAPLAERWNGRRWGVQRVPASVSFGTGLGGLSCPSARMCLAVSGGQTDLWNGTSWVVKASVNPVPQGGLFAVACRSATRCIGVGSVGIAGGGYRTLAERWNGKTWVRYRTPAGIAGGQPNEPTSVSCHAAKVCMAVGSAGSNMLAELWNGTAWSLREPRAPAGATSSSLAAVSCPAAAACVAVGSEQESGGANALAEKWNGRSWATLPSPADATSLAGIWCATAIACVAVGAGASGPVAESWNGSAWASEALAAGVTSLTAVSCVTTAACMAVGSDGSKPAAEYWQGSGWTLQSLPAGGTLAAVSCLAASGCTAVGDKGATDHWNGTTWSVQRSPTGKADLTGISCSSGSDCEAVGGYSSDSPFPTPLLAAHWNGSKWTIQAATAPGGSTGSWLQAVSCTSASSCMAVGTNINALNEFQTLAERYP